MDQSTMPLTDLSVAKYLKNHPFFFENYPELLLDLKMTHRSGAAISLMQKQVELLRERCTHQQKTIQNTLEIARENSDLFESIKRLTLKLLEVNDFEALQLQLEASLQRDFGAHAMELMIMNAEKSSSPLIEAQHGHQEDDYYCGRICPEEREQFFPNHNDVQSYAKIPLHFNQSRAQGLLLIGSRHAENFHPSKDTLFLQFIGNMLERILPPFITQQEGHPHGSRPNPT